jgi:hypothetical protein
METLYQSVCTADANKPPKSTSAKPIIKAPLDLVLKAHFAATLSPDHTFLKKFFTLSIFPFL